MSQVRYPLHIICHSSSNRSYCMMPSLITWTSQVSTPDSRLAQEWWDVKGVVKALTPDATNPDPFKQGVKSPLRDLPLGDCTKYIKIDPAESSPYLCNRWCWQRLLGQFNHNSMPGRALWKWIDTPSISECPFKLHCLLQRTKKNTSISEFDYSTFKLPQNSFLVLWILVGFWHLNMTIEQLKLRYVHLFCSGGPPNVWDSAIDRTLAGYPENRSAYLNNNGVRGEVHETILSLPSPN